MLSYLPGLTSGQPIPVLRGGARAHRGATAASWGHHVQCRSLDCSVQGALQLLRFNQCQEMQVCHWSGQCLTPAAAQLVQFEPAAPLFPDATQAVFARSRGMRNSVLAPWLASAALVLAVLAVAAALFVMRRHAARLRDAAAERRCKRRAARHSARHTPLPGSHMHAAVAPFSPTSAGRPLRAGSEASGSGHSEAGRAAAAAAAIAAMSPPPFELQLSDSLADAGLL